jgi:transcription-repair coupling factor (superfamily II helicase)
MTTQANPFVRMLLHDAAFSEAAAALWSGKSISVDGITGSSCALAITALLQSANDSMIVVTPNAETAENVAEDITLFIEPEYQLNVLVFLPMTQHDHESDATLAIADESFGKRVSVLKKLASHTDARFVLIVSMPALLQPVPPPDLLKERTQTLAVNSRVDIESLRRFLVEGGYHATTAVDLPGEFAVRGYILDLFAPDWDQPVRIEFFNDEIESIRQFDLTTQRSLEKIADIDLTRLQPNEFSGASLLDYFAPTVPIVLVEPERFGLKDIG